MRCYAKQKSSKLVLYYTQTLTPSKTFKSQKAKHISSCPLQSCHVRWTGRAWPSCTAWRFAQKPEILTQSSRTDSQQVPQPSAKTGESALTLTASVKLPQNTSATELYHTVGLDCATGSDVELIVLLLGSCPASRAASRPPRCKKWDEVGEIYPALSSHMKYEHWGRLFFLCTNYWGQMSLFAGGSTLRSRWEHGKTPGLDLPGTHASAAPGHDYSGSRSLPYEILEIMRGLCHACYCPLLRGSRWVFGTIIQARMGQYRSQTRCGLCLQCVHGALAGALKLLLREMVKIPQFGSSKLV